MQPKIWLSSPHMSGLEREYVAEAFDTNWVAPLGPHVDGLEADIALYLGNDMQVAALSSGTAALHLALIIAGVTAGDEVICQSMTFSASANPVVYQGAQPVFVDSEPETCNMSPDYLEEAILDGIRRDRKAKAIIVVHLYGMPADMERISAIARKYEILVIEDAAEALGSSINGRACGTFGDLGVLSFNGNKIITTSGGGALLSSKQEWIEKARFLSTQARDPAPHFQHSQIGYNYRMSNICAGIGRGQMKVLQKRIDQRRSNYDFYNEMLRKYDSIKFIEEPQGYFSNRWLTTLLVDADNNHNVDREVIRLALADANIEARPLWKPMHLQPVYSNCRFFGDGLSGKLFEMGLCLPSGSNLTKENLHSVVRVIQSVFA